jgi:hypothetical protein
MRILPIIAAVLAAGALSGCAEFASRMQRGTSGIVTPTGEGRPTGPIALGDYDKDKPDDVRRDFAGDIIRRYAVGAPLRTATADLAANKFECAKSTINAPDPPAQICRRQIKTGDCVNVWSAYLYDTKGDAKIARVRALYDRRCAADPLLGG